MTLLARPPRENRDPLSGAIATRTRSGDGRRPDRLDGLRHGRASLPVLEDEAGGGDLLIDLCPQNLPALPLQSWPVA